MLDCDRRVVFGSALSSCRLSSNSTLDSSIPAGHNKCMLNKQGDIGCCIGIGRKTEVVQILQLNWIIQCLLFYEESGRTRFGGVR